MQDIYPLYHNHFGISFQWKRETPKISNKVQMVFRDTGLFLTKKELLQFSKSVKCTMENSPLCQDCTKNKSCKALLLSTPAHQVSLAVSEEEIIAIHDLVEGTLFQLNLDALLYQ